MTVRNRKWDKDEEPFMQIVDERLNMKNSTINDFKSSNSQRNEVLYRWFVKIYFIFLTLVFKKTFGRSVQLAQGSKFPKQEPKPGRGSESTKS